MDVVRPTVSNNSIWLIRSWIIRKKCWLNDKNVIHDYSNNLEFYSKEYA